MSPYRTTLLVAFMASSTVACESSPRGTDPTHILRAAIERVAPATSGSGDSSVGRPAFIVYSSGTLNQSAELQGRRAGREDSSRFREAIALLPDGRVGHEIEHYRIDGTHDLVREVYQPGSKTIHIMEDGFSVRLTDGPEVSGVDRIRRRFPRQLLEEALAASGSPGAVSALDENALGPTVRFQLDSGAVLTLSFGRSDTMLGAVAYSATLPGIGDATVRWTYRDYRRVAGVGLLPHCYEVEIAGATFLSMQVDSVAVDSSLAHTFVAPPEGFADPIEVPLSGGDASARATVEDVAESVFVIRNLRTGFHPMFVEFRDFVVAVDAPVGYPIMIELPAGDVAPGPAPDWLARRYIELIRQAIPDKPIRYVVVTHFHNDHGGGVRAFVAEGATVLTTAADEDAVRSYVAAPHNVSPDLLSERPAALQLEVVSDRRVISDGELTLEVLATGANPHTDDMLTVHLPQHEIVYVSDLMNSLPEDVSNIRRDNPPLAFFLEWLVDTGLDPVRILTMHGTGAERPEWRRAYELMR